VASPQLDEFQARTEAQEQPLIRAVLAWIAEQRAAVTVEDIILAIGSGSATGILYALGRAKRLVLDLLPAAEAEGQVALDEIEGASRLNLRFDIRDPRFEIAVEQQGAKAITEIDMETRAAVQRIVADGYRNGWHPRVFAPAIAETVGLTTRSTIAVANSFKAQVDAGVREDIAQRNADKYAKRLALQRATVIARTETMRGHSIARREAWLQAQRHGLFAGKTVWEEWMAVQTDPNEICYQMNGRRTPLGHDFDGLYPPVHPQCRCVTIPVFE
jgi:hypothetical protein